MLLPSKRRHYHSTIEFPAYVAKHLIDILKLLLQHVGPQFAPLRLRWHGQHGRNDSNRDTFEHVCPLRWPAKNPGTRQLAGEYRQRGNSD
jgi:hypothetical protein